MKKLLQSRTLPLLVAAFILLVDSLSKYLTHLYLPVMQRSSLWYPYGGIPVFKDFFGVQFSISHQINSGAAWGMLAAYQLPLLYFRLALIALLILYALFYNKRPELKIPLAMIIAGAMGNVLDYYLYGHVVDMLHFVLWGYDFPVFNVADSSIFLGIASMFFLESFEKRKKAHAGRK